MQLRKKNMVRHYASKCNPADNNIIAPATTTQISTGGRQSDPTNSRRMLEHMEGTKSMHIPNHPSAYGKTTHADHRGRNPLGEFMRS
jgi:hypothetical protein